MGGPFAFGANALDHGKIEGWVNERVQAEIPPGIGGSPGGYDAIFINSLSTYFDPKVQDLLIAAYNSAYAGGQDCKGRPNFASLTRDEISAAAQAMIDYVMVTHGGLSAPFKIGATLNWTQPLCRELAQALRLALWPDLFMLHPAERALDPTGESS